MTGKRSASRRARRSASRRLVPAVWGASALVAVVLVLGVNGTLSAWTSAIITNSNDTVATTSAVILQETGGGQTCLSSSGVGASNSFSCSTINKYGGTVTPLAPGGSQTMDVTFTNVGSAAASSFVLAPGGCGQAPVAGALVNNLCTNGDLTVALSCSPTATYTAGSAWTDLVSGPVAPGSLPTLTHAAGLAAGGVATCRFTLALSATANPLDQGVTVNQPLTWTLNK